MSVRDTLLRAASATALLKVSALALGLATSVLLARTLGPDQYGTYALVTSIVTLLSLPLHAGLPGLLVRETARIAYDEDWQLLRGLRRRVIQWILLGSLLICLAVWSLSGAIMSGVSSALLLVALPLAPLMALNKTRAAMLRGLRHVVSAQLPESVVQPVAHLALLSALLVCGWLDVQGALVSLVAGTLLACVMGQFFLSRAMNPLVGPPGTNYSTRLWLRALVPFSMLAAISVVNGQLSTLILGVFSSPQEIGYLRVADRTTQLIALSLTVMNFVAAPHIARAAKASRSEEVRSLAVRTGRISLIWALPVALGLIVMGQPLLSLIFGSEYAAPSWPALLVLSLGQVVNVACGPVALVLSMSGHERDALIGVTAGFLVNAAVATILAKPFGALGGAIGVMAGMVTWNAFLVWRVRSRLGITINPLGRSVS